MLRALRGAGIRVETHVVGRERPIPTRARAAIIDTIASRAASPHIARMRAAGMRVIALALMEEGAVALARRADAVVALSRSLTRELVEAGVPRTRIAIVSPGRDGTRHAPRSVTRERDVARDVRVLCVANWTPGKGIHTLLEAIDGVPNVTVDLVGDAPDARYAAIVRKRARRLGGRVREYGPLGPPALARRYATASIFALPSVREGYGIAYAEALAHGLPVVACDIPVVREVTDGAAVLVPAGEVRPLAVALRRLATDARARSALARRARERARSLPTWRQMEAQIVRVMRAELRRAATAGRVAGARRTRAGRLS